MMAGFRSAVAICLALLLPAGSAAPGDPPIRTLGEQEVRDLIVGSAIVATRGNLKPIAGLVRSSAEALLAEGKPFRIIALEDLPDDWTVAEAAGRIGGGSAWPEVAARMKDRRVPAVPSSEGRRLALQALSRSVGRDIDAVVRSEAAGATIAAFQAAIANGLPVVDACPTGRAVPEVTQSLPFINGISPAPAAFVSRWGDVVVVDRAADYSRVEDIGRSLAVGSGGTVLMAGTAMSGKEARRVLIPGSITENIAFGRAVREARERGDDPIDALLDVAGGFRLFRGTVTQIQGRDDQGFNWWDVKLDGTGEFAGHAYRVWVKNENILAWLDGRPDAMSPDLILPLDPVTGEAILTSALGGYPQGAEIVLVGIPASPMWRTPEGIAVLGPRHFGFDFDYVPLETLRARNQIN